VFESWSSLANLLRDCLVLAPPAVFLALSILNQFVNRSPTLAERKDQKELQDIAGKLVDSCAQIGGSCLEQTTWLRRNLAVNADLQLETAKTIDIDITETSTKVVQLEESSDSARKAMTQYAVPALALLGKNIIIHALVTVLTSDVFLILGEMLAPLLDIVFTSEEKEKVLPLLYTVMYNVVPYLKNHSRGNMASFKACSKLLASLSEYQYTRKAWKKEAIELLLDPAFFQMDTPSLQQWKATIDNLMTHDKTTFKELMGKCLDDHHLQLFLFVFII
jgi:hypothetical protein